MRKDENRQKAKRVRNRGAKLIRGINFYTFVCWRSGWLSIRRAMENCS